MRRLLSLAMLLLLCWPLIAPAFAGDLELHLPACCRRNGAHHCSGMMMPGTNPTTPALIATPPHCPAYPAAVTQTQQGTLFLPIPSLIYAGIISHPAVHFQTEARARIALDQSRQKRGPPQAA